MTWKEKIGWICWFIQGKVHLCFSKQKLPYNFLGSGSRETLSSVEQDSCSGHKTEAVTRNFWELADIWT